MSKLSKPVNDWAKCLWILHDNYMGGVNMAKVLTKYDNTFYKWQTRLSDIMKEHPKLKVSKVPIPFSNKITGKTGYFYQYTLLSPTPYVKNLYNKINQNGLKTPTKKP